MVTHTASTPTELNTVLGVAVGGDVIELSTGNYGALTITGRNYASDVTIQEGAGQTATITKVLFDGCSRIRLLGLSLLTAAMVSGSTDFAFGAVNGSSYLTAESCVISGPAGEATMPGGYATYLENGTHHVTITKCSVGQLRTAITAIGSDDLTFTYNTGLDVGEDFAKLGGNGLTFTHNMIDVEFRPEVGAHPDFVQVNSSSSNMEYGFNIFLGRGATAQVIFFGGQFFAQTYENIHIHNNICQGQLDNGIACKNVDPAHTSINVVIENNLVFWLANPAQTTKKSTYISWAGATKRNNVEHRNVQGGDPGIGGELALNNNNPGDPYYLDNFYADLTVAFGTQLTAANFNFVPGSKVDPANEALGPTALIAAWQANGGVWPPTSPAPPVEPPAPGPQARQISGQTLTISVAVA